MDGQGLPLAVTVASASPHEVKLVERTLQDQFLEHGPQRRIGDMAYDSDALDQKLAEQGIELIVPHRQNRAKAATQDGQPLRRDVRRWKMERFWAWLRNYRRIVVRYERYAANYFGFVLVGSLLILVQAYLWDDF